MSAQAKRLGRQMAEAWAREEKENLSSDGLLGDDTAAALTEALDSGCLQESLAQARMLSMPLEAAALLNREAERKAGIWLWDPDEDGLDDKESILLAVPCSGDSMGFNHWLASPSHRMAFAQACQDHLALSTGLSRDRIERLALHPVLINPPAIARLTAESRRELMLELLGEGERRVLNLLDADVVPTQDPDNPNLALTMTEGMLLMSVVVRSDWGIHVDDDLTTPNLLLDMAHSQMDEDFLDQTEQRWQAAQESMGLPPLALVLQPMAINDALLHTLHSSLMAARIQTQSIENLEAMRDAGEIQLPSVERLEVLPTDGENIRINVFTEEGQISIDVMGHWAFVEGEDAFRHALADAMGLELEDDGWEKLSGPTEDMDAKQQADGHEHSGEESEPMWARNMGRPKILH